MISEKPSSIELSEEDRKLLEKWQNMQKVATHNGKAIVAEKTDTVVMQNTDSVTQSVANIFIRPPDTSLKSTLTKPAEVIQQNPSANLQGQASIPVQVLPVSQGLHNSGSFPNTRNPVSLLISQSNVTSTVSTQPAVTLGTSTVSTGNLSLALSEGSGNALTSNVAESQPFMSVPFGSYTQWPNADNPSVIQLRLPSYTEALQAKTNQSEICLEKSNPAVPLTTVSLPPVVGVKPVLSNEHWPSSELNGANKDESDMRIITKQLRQSNVEDLTLTNTPKGTGGGYGVACDLDLLENVPTEQKLETKYVIEKT